MLGELDLLAADADLRRSIAARGLATVRARHTCGHRVDELLAIVGEVRGKEAEEVLSA